MRSEAPALLPIFRSQLQAEVLTSLLLHPEQEHSLSELAAQMDAPLSTLHREVGRLVEAGLLTARSHGRNRLVRADMSHPAAPALAALLEIVFGPKPVIREEFSSLEAEFVAIFGSWAARYEGSPGPPPNDIDVLVVGDVERLSVYDAADRAQARLGFKVNPVVFSRARWFDTEDLLASQVRSSATVTVIPEREVVHDGALAQR